VDIRDSIAVLVSKYNNLSSKQRKEFNEANTANVFIRPLFELLGWDFADMDEIVAEHKIIKGRVDYIFRVNNVTRLCLEVKALRHQLTDNDRQQAISYSYNKGVTWAVLTNFDSLEVFNADVKTNDLMAVRFISLTCSGYMEDLNKLQLLSKESIGKNKLDDEAVAYGKLARRVPVQKRLYQEMITWRETLFNEVYQYNKEKGITMDHADKLVQKLFSRLLFIRTTEDRGLAGNHPLLSALHQWQTSKVSLLGNVLSIFKDFTRTFDSEIFPDTDLWQNIWINDNSLAEVISGLYTVPNDFAQYYFDVIEPDVLGQVYEQYLGHVARIAKPKLQAQQSLFPSTDVKIEILEKGEKRKKGGIYYTPKWVTDYIVRNTINRFISEQEYNSILNMRIVDPACGSGSFLIRAYDELLTYNAKVTGKPVSALTWPERIRILTSNIYGVDLDPQAVEIARLNLLIRALAKRDLLPPLESNIQCGNSLIFGTEDELESALGSDYQSYNPFTWSDRFESIMKKGGFDIVIGNPPYIMELRDNKDIFQVLRKTPLGTKYYEPKMDIFYFFMELGLDLLKPNGYLGFIVQQYWLSRAHASKLREKVFAESHPIALIDLNEYKVFADAPGQHNMIVILQKSKSSNDRTLLLRLKKADANEADIVSALSCDPDDQQLFETRLIETSQLLDTVTDKVYMIGTTSASVKAKIERECWQLDANEIQQGIVIPQSYLNTQALSKLSNPSLHISGEGIFVLSLSEQKRLKLNSAEKSLLRPFHYAEEIDNYYYDKNVGYNLIYTSGAIAKEIESSPHKYPNLISHLDKYRTIITSDHKPYGLHRARQPEWFDDKNKIICVRKTKYPKFVVVSDPWYGDQSVLVIRLTKHNKFSPHFVAAVLNSNVAHYWLKLEKHQGNQLQIDKEVLIHFPLPNIDFKKSNAKANYDNLVKLSLKVAKSKRDLGEINMSGQDLFGEKQKILSSSIDKLIKQANDLVYSLYGLDQSDIQQIIEGTSF
jgi:type I restriction-modification system DNA methylase subunit